MATIRYPYNRRPRPDFCEVPIDVEDRSAGTILVKLVDIPREKFVWLERLLDTSKRAFLRITQEKIVAIRAATGQMEGSSESEIFRALAVVQRTENIKPAVKRLLKRTLEDLARKVGEAQASPEGRWLAELRAVCVGGGLPGLRVLAFAEACDESAQQLAEQLIEEAFVTPFAESVRAMRAARGELIRHGVIDHKDLFGALTLDDGAPMLDEQGQPMVEPIPFESSAWSWGGKKKPGCSVDTLTLYNDISERGGCLMSLSESVLFWNRGIVPTPELIWSEWEKTNSPPQPKETKEEPAPLISRDGDAPSGEVVPFGEGA